MTKKWIIGIVFALLLVLTACNKSSEPGKYDAFAQCLTANDVVMYGTEWCSHCQNQKKMLGNSFQYIDYVDCDRNEQQCYSAGIRGYPTWNIKGENYPGEKNLFELSQLSGCDIS